MEMVDIPVPERLNTTDPGRHQRGLTEEVEEILPCPKEHLAHWQVALMWKADAHLLIHCNLSSFWFGFVLAWVDLDGTTWLIIWFCES